MLSHDNLVQLCSLLSSLTGLHVLKLTNIFCSDNNLNLGLPVLDLHRHSRLKVLSLNSISISGLLLPSQEQSQLLKLYLGSLVLSHDRSISGLLLPCQENSNLYDLYLWNLVLSHDNLVQLCSLLSSLTGLRELTLTNISCSDNSLNLGIPVLDLHRHCRIKVLSLNSISISGLLLPCQEQSKLRELHLDNQVLSHDSFVQLCSFISSLSALKCLQLTNLRCYDHGGSGDIPILDFPKAELEYVDLEQIQVEDLQALSGLEDLQLSIMPYSEYSGECKFTVLDLHKHHKLKVLTLDTSSISGILLPRQERLRFERLVLRNLVLSRYSLEQLSDLLPSMFDLNAELILTDLHCSDHGGSYFLPVLNFSCPDSDTESSFDSD